jgi:hypothetical protein
MEPVHRSAVDHHGALELFDSAALLAASDLFVFPTLGEKGAAATLPGSVCRSTFKSFQSSTEQREI